jgi:mono/diheme cytochrome c family protein
MILASPKLLRTVAAVFVSSASSAVIALGLWASPAHLTGLAAQSSATPVAFTDAQAGRGENLYLDECSSCHGSTLRGVGEFGGPGLIGERFLVNWRGKALADLFERTQSTMPQDSPGRLRAQEYADIIAFILKSNDYPAGSQELTPALDRLKQITISDPPQSK